MAKVRVAVLMGGMSSEHEVSLKSGAMVSGCLSRDRYEVAPVIITPQGQWKFPGARPCALAKAVGRLLDLAPDCVFLALHGPFGEDGRVQGFLDLLGLPYIGSGCAASAIAIDKVRSKSLVADAGVRVPRQLVITRREWDAHPESVSERVAAELGFPCVLKSPCQGSSLGMAIPKEPAQFRKSLLNVFAFDDTVLVEEYLKGVEVTCGVLDVEPDEDPVALPVTEIRPVHSEFFDYEAKYTPGACEEITPARISPETARRVQDAALRAHRCIGCRGLSRSDMILVDDEPVWFEVNTIPGMTETSLLPQGAAAAGIEFPELLDRLIDGALAWARRHKGA